MIFESVGSKNGTIVQEIERYGEKFAGNPMFTPIWRNAEEEEEFQKTL